MGHACTPARPFSARRKCVAGRRSPQHKRLIRGQNDGIGSGSRADRTAGAGASSGSGAATTAPWHGYGWTDAMSRRCLSTKPSRGGGRADGPSRTGVEARPSCRARSGLSSPTSIPPLIRPRRPPGWKTVVSFSRTATTPLNRSATALCAVRSFIWDARSSVAP